MPDDPPRHPLAPSGVGQDPHEAFDLLDEEGRRTGEVKARHAVHRDGDWHAAVHLWIVDDEDRLVVQRRSRFKDLAPGKLDVTVGGHLAAGEHWPSALREAEEEIGRPVEVGDVRHLGRFRSERVYADAVDREFQEVLVARVPGPIRQYRLDPNEVEALYALPVARAILLWRDGRFAPVEGWDAQARPSHALLHEDDLIEQARASQLNEIRLVAAWIGVEVPPIGFDPDFAI